MRGQGFFMLIHVSVSVKVETRGTARSLNHFSADLAAIG